jgi:hypothetical protein
MSDKWEVEGGPAFPSTTRKVTDTEESETFYKGMSLRDWFAGKALNGLIAFPGMVEGGLTKSPGPVVRIAYEYADAMLKEREKGLP